MSLIYVFQPLVIRWHVTLRNRSYVFYVIRATNLENKCMVWTILKYKIGLVWHFLNVVLQQTVWFDAENLQSSFNPIFELPGAEEDYQFVTILT